MSNTENKSEEALKPNCIKKWLDMSPPGYRQTLVKITGISESYLTFLANGYRDNPSLRHAKALVTTINELNKEIKVYYGVTLPDITLDDIADLKKYRTYVSPNKKAE